MTIISVKGGNSQEILDGSQDTLSLLAITTGTGLVHVGDPAPEGFDVPFRGGDQVILPANEPATLRADGFIVTGSIGAYGGQIYSGGGTPEPFWEPFTVTAGPVDTSVWGYANYEGEPTIGSITNEPVSGYTLRECYVNGIGEFRIRIDGPTPLLVQLSGALVGVNAEDFSIPEGNAESQFENGVWQNTGTAEGVPAWTVGQQVPIVIIPQNG